MAFATKIGNYLRAYEAHNQFELPCLDELVNALSVTTFSDIMINYNNITYRKLWVEPLMNVFNEEVLKRALEATFLISVCWIDNNPEGAIQIGYSEKYQAISPLNLPLFENTYKYSLIGSENLSKDNVQRIIRIILRENVGLELGFNNEILSIYNSQDPIEKIVFSNEKPVSTTRPRLHFLGDFALMVKILKNFRTNIGIIDY